MPLLCFPYKISDTFLWLTGFRPSPLQTVCWLCCHINCPSCSLSCHNSAKMFGKLICLDPALQSAIKALTDIVDLNLSWSVNAFLHCMCCTVMICLAIFWSSAQVVLIGIWEMFIIEDTVVQISLQCQRRRSVWMCALNNHTLTVTVPLIIFLEMFVIDCKCCFVYCCTFHFLLFHLLFNDHFNFSP
jgi:hypothetical protein